MLISRQTVVIGSTSWLREDAEWSINPHDPSAAQFSILDQLEGMRPDGTLVNPPECHRTYSSVFANQACGEVFARSMLDSPQAWSAGASTAGQWMRIDAGGALSVHGVRVQGRADVGQKVTAFTVQHSTDDSTWSDVDGGATFTDASGNLDALFATPVMAQYIRITVVSWYAYISMRAGLLTGDNKFLFELYWPELEGSPKGPRQLWKQSSNPVLGVPGADVDGYEAVDAPYTTALWGGLQRSGRATLLDGSTKGTFDQRGAWWYSVGTKSNWNGAMPGPGGIGVSQTELYVHTPCGSLSPPPPRPPSSPPPPSPSPPPPPPPPPPLRASASAVPTRPWSAARKKQGSSTSRSAYCHAAPGGATAPSEVR